MSLTEDEKAELLAALGRLTPSQQKWIQNTVMSFDIPHDFWRLETSDVIIPSVLEALGDRLISHHSSSRQALSKDRFEHALESALNSSNIHAELVKSRTNPGHDITINHVPVGLKSEAAANIRMDTIHISKWMELGKGEWKFELLLERFLNHLKNYERVFTLRCYRADAQSALYELVEIPKKLLLEAERCELSESTSSKQNPKPGYGKVKDASGSLKYQLYFDGGSERKLQIQHLKKSCCIVHARWEFGKGPT